MNVLYIVISWAIEIWMSDLMCKYKEIYNILLVRWKNYWINIIKMQAAVRNK